MKRELIVGKGERKEFTYEEAYTQYKRLIDNKCKSLVSSLKYILGEEDFESEYHLYFLEVFNSYDVTKGYAFSTYAVTSMSNKFKQTLRYYNCEKRNIDITNDTASMDCETKAPSGEGMTLEEMTSNGDEAIEDKVLMNLAYKKIQEIYNESDEQGRDLIRCMFGKISAIELSKKWGTSKQTQHNKMNKLKEIIIGELKKDKILTHVADNSYKKKIKKPTDKKRVEIFKDGVSLGVYKSMLAIQKVSVEKFGEKLYANGISLTFTNSYTSYKGYTFKRLD